MCTDVQGALRMTIRTATTNDIPALRELYLEREKDGVRYQPEHFVIGTRTDEFFQTIFDSPTQDILVADVEVRITVDSLHIVEIAVG